MKLSKSLNILSWVYMDLALFILAIIAKLLPVNAKLATRALETDMVIFLIGVLLSHLSKYYLNYEKEKYDKRRKAKSHSCSKIISTS